MRSPQTLKVLALVPILLLPSFAQGVGRPVSAPDDVVLRLEAEGSHQFHLGEFIPIKFSYAANAPGKYLWVADNANLEGGHSLEISCSPAAERVRQLPSRAEELAFDEMLMAPCGGVGGGSGGGCGDCTGEVPLVAAPLTFGIVPLNTYVRFRTQGTYTCQASSAEITATFRNEKIRPALLVMSNPIVLNIVEDPAWAHSADAEYADAYDKVCRGDDVAEHRFLQCSDVARRITYLDTADSLATEVHMFDGRSHGWDNGFWGAIRESSYPQQALRLMTLRVQEPDFQPSTDVLEWLASSELRMEVPDAFQDSKPSTYHAQAVEKLRKYVRLLGNSLSKKDRAAVRESANTYRTFAEQQYCEGESLISKEERNRMLATAVSSWR